MNMFFDFEDSKIIGSYDTKTAMECISFSITYIV